MLNLVLTTDKLQVTTGQAVTVDVHASFVDLLAGAVTPGKQNTAISTAATTDIVAAPAASTVRNVKTLNIRNKHASSPVDVTVIYDANGTDYELHKVTLQAGDVLEYVEGVGFFVVAATTSPMLRTYRLLSDVSNSTTTTAEVTGWSPGNMTTGLGTFAFNMSIIHQAAATTTGIKFGVNHTGTVTQIVFWIEQTSATITAADGIQDQDIALVTGGLINVNAARAKATTAVGAGSLSVDTANADMLTVIRGIVTVTADGDLELWHGSEVAAASTVKAGTGVEITRMGS